MIQYLELLKVIKEKGANKPPARENMPSSQSLFGYQFRHNLKDGFPLLTTKEINFKHIIVELLWFLRGDTNIKYLVDNDVNIWNEDAYNYYKKKCEENDLYEISFVNFINAIKERKMIDDLQQFHCGRIKNYRLGDCGYQYGKVWRNWQGFEVENEIGFGLMQGFGIIVDQIAKIISSLKNEPQSRRHILTSIDPAHDNELALYWCHALTQFNCRLLTEQERLEYANNNCIDLGRLNDIKNFTEHFDEFNIPKYYLDCQMYQRSADSFLGVPYNIASYALLTEILCKMCNMVHGEMIYSYGDLHIYENHQNQVDEILSRIPSELPTLNINPTMLSRDDINVLDTNELLMNLLPSDFTLNNYNPQSKIKAKLSTGLL